MRQHAEQHVARVRDGGIREQALHAALHDGDEIAENHGNHRHDGDDRHPARRVVAPCAATFRSRETEHHDFREDEEARDLRAAGDECRARHGRALVGVWRPQVKRHGGDLKSKADHGHHDGEDEQRIETLARQRGGDLAEVGRSSKSVKQTHAEQCERRRHAAEQEIFQRRLRRFRVVLVERRQDVEREARQLQRDEDHQQVFRADEEHHADGREQDECEKFADVIGEVGIHREEHRENRQHQQRDLDQLC